MSLAPATHPARAAAVGAHRTSPAPTSAAPRGQTLWRGSRGPLALLALLLVVLVGAAVLRATGGAALDPRSFSPDGSRALASLLADAGSPVTVVGDLPGLRAELGPGSTVLVPRPQELTAVELAEIGGLGAQVVVVGAGPDEVDALGVPATDEGSTGSQVLRAACELPAALRAGTALTGGEGYRADRGTPAVGCYSTGGTPSLLALPAQRLVLLGAPDLLTNAELAHDGNAALAVGLLAGGDEVLWLLPDGTRDLGAAPRPLSELLPDGLRTGVLQLVVAVAVLALWRGRRLGRVVAEPLPVVVRAAETIEGRGRLYRAAGARATAAEVLRDAARDRLALRLGLPRDSGRQGLVETLAARSGRGPVELDDLLYGPAPVDDAALVRLADALDGLRA